MIFNKNRFIETLKQHSYYRDSIKWDKFREKVFEIKKIDLKTINNLLEQIDKHSFAIYNHRKSKKDKLLSETPKIITKEYSKDIGFLKLPGFFTLDNDRYSKNYEDIVFALKKLRYKKKLILDLSNNTGGNMYPWLAALAPLYDEKCVGYFDYKYKNKKDEWLIKKNGVYCGNKKWFDEINSDKFYLEKTAVLVSSQTSSSGEAIAISFIGQSNIKILDKKLLITLQETKNIKSEK